MKFEEIEILHSDDVSYSNELFVSSNYRTSSFAFNF